MDIYRFDPEHAVQAHENTILAAPVLPAEFKCPFEHAWGYLAGPGKMEVHTHEDKQEYYCFFEGEGFVELDGVKSPVRCGDIVLVRPHVAHSVINEQNLPLKWAAFWWPVIK